MERHDCLKDNVIDSCCACYILCRWIVILCCLHIMMSCTSSILCRWIIILCSYHVMMSCACSILCRWVVGLCCIHIMMSCACSILCRWVVILWCHHVMMGCACSMLCRWIVRLCCLYIMMSCACSILCRWIVILSSRHYELHSIHFMLVNSYTMLWLYFIILCTIYNKSFSCFLCDKHGMLCVTYLSSWLLCRILIISWCAVCTLHCVVVKRCCIEFSEPTRLRKPVTSTMFNLRLKSLRIHPL